MCFLTKASYSVFLSSLLLNKTTLSVLSLPHISILLSHKPKGHGFDSWPGHTPRLWGSEPNWGVCKRQQVDFSPSHWCFSLTQKKTTKKNKSKIRKWTENDKEPPMWLAVKYTRVSPSSLSPSRAAQCLPVDLQGQTNSPAICSLISSKSSPRKGEKSHKRASSPLKGTCQIAGGPRIAEPTFFQMPDP